MKRILLVISTLLILLVQGAHAGNYRYVSAEQLKGVLETSQKVLLVDIQEKKDFAAHYIKGSLETNAYPVKSDAEGRYPVAMPGQTKVL